MTDPDRHHDTPTAAAGSLADHVQRELARLAGEELGAHPHAYESLDATIRAELRALDQA